MNQSTYNDFEAYAESVQGVDMRCLVQRLEVPVWSIRHFNLGELLLQWASEGIGNIAAGAAGIDGFILKIQRSGKWGRANGIQFGPGDMAVVGAGAEFCIASDDADDWCSLFLPIDFLSQAEIVERNGRFAAHFLTTSK